MNENDQNDLINKIAILEQLITIKNDGSTDLMKENDKLINKRNELMKENEKLINKQNELMKENEKLLNRQIELMKENGELEKKQNELINNSKQNEDNIKIQTENSIDKDEDVVKKSSLEIKQSSDKKSIINKDNTDKDCSEYKKSFDIADDNKKIKENNIKKYSFKELQIICVLFNINFNTADRTKDNLVNKILNANISIKELHHKINKSNNYKFIIECRNREDIKDLKCGCKMGDWIIGNTIIRTGMYLSRGLTCQKNHVHYYFTNDILFDDKSNNKTGIRYFIKKQCCNICNNNCEAEGFINVFYNNI